MFFYSVEKGVGIAELEGGESGGGGRSKIALPLRLGSSIKAYIINAKDSKSFFVPNLRELSISKI